MNIKYNKRSLKFLAKLEAKQRERIRAAVKKIPAGDIVPLEGSESSYRLRVGDWRVLYTMWDANSLTVDKISPRGDAYKKG